MNGLRVLTAGSVFLFFNMTNVRPRTYSLPSLTYRIQQGVLLYISSGVVAMAAQSLLLRQPAVRAALAIPQIPEHLRQPAPSMIDSFHYLRKTLRQRIDDAKRAQQEANSGRRY